MSKWEKLVRNLETDIKEDLFSSKTLKHLWYVPEENAQKDRFNGIVFLGLNSGGKTIRNKDLYEKFIGSDGWSYYHSEVWQNGKKEGEAPLQIQIRLLFIYLYKKTLGELFRYDTTMTSLQNIERAEAEDGYNLFMKGLLAGNVCPFQSSSINNLLYPWDLQRRHLEEFWTKIFNEELHGKTRTLVTMGREVLGLAKKIFAIKEDEFEHVPTGWGSTCINLFCSNNPAKPSIINLPHLSRCKIFGRKEGLTGIEKVFMRDIF